MTWDERCVVDQPGAVRCHRDWRGGDGVKRLIRKQVTDAIITIGVLARKADDLAIATTAEGVAVNTPRISMLNAAALELISNLPAEVRADPKIASYIASITERAAVIDRLLAEEAAKDGEPDQGPGH